MAQGYDYKYGEVSGGKRGFLIGALVLVLAVTFMFEWAISGYFIFSDVSQSDFAGGTLTNVSWDTDHLEVAGGKDTGVYTSAIRNAGDPASWDIFSWATGIAPSDGLVMMFHLNEADGNVTDSSGNGNVGTYNGALYSQSGKVGNAMGFDGDDYINVAPLQTVSGEFTVSAWAKLGDDSGSTHEIVGTRGPNGETSFDMKFDNCGDLCLHGDIGDGTDWLTNNADVNLDYVSGTWYHIAYVVNGTGYAIYVDGDKVASDFAAFDGDPLLYDTNDDHHFFIGQVGYDDEYFNGTIDEVRVYDRALSDSEVSAIYDSESPSIGMEAMSCDDAACSGETWTALSSSPAALSVDDNQYFQYRALLSGSAKLYNASVEYSSVTQHNSTIAGGSTATNSNIYHSYLLSASTVTDSFLKWANVSGTTVVNSNITGCMIFNNSNITNIRIWDAFVSGNYMYSGSLVYDSVFYDAPLNISELYWPPVPPVAPNYTSMNSNTTTPAPGDPVRMSAYWQDDGTVDTVLLETNDTGSFAVRDFKVLGVQSGWSDLVWHDDSVGKGTVIAWRLKANDTGGTTTTTSVSTIIVTEPSAAETQQTTSVSSSGGGSCTRNFDITSVDSLMVESGKTYTVDITIKNTGTCALFETTLMLEVPSSWTKGPDAYFDVINAGESKTAKLSFTTHKAIIGDYNIIVAMADSVGMDKTNKIVAKTKAETEQTVAPFSASTSAVGKPATAKEQAPAIITPLLMICIVAAVVVLWAYGKKGRPWSTKLTAPIHRKHKK